MRSSLSDIDDVKISKEKDTNLIQREKVSNDWHREQALKKKSVEKRLVPSGADVQNDGDYRENVVRRKVMTVTRKLTQVPKEVVTSLSKPSSAKSDEQKEYAKIVEQKRLVIIELKKKNEAIKVIYKNIKKLQQKHLQFTLVSEECKLLLSKFDDYYKEHHSIVLEVAVLQEKFDALMKDNLYDNNEMSRDTKNKLTKLQNLIILISKNIVTLDKHFTHVSKDCENFEALLEKQENKSDRLLENLPNSSSVANSDNIAQDIALSNQPRPVVTEKDKALTQNAGNHDAEDAGKHDTDLGSSYRDVKKKRVSQSAQEVVEGSVSEENIVTKPSSTMLKNGESLEGRSISETDNDNSSTSLEKEVDSTNISTQQEKTKDITYSVVGSDDAPQNSTESSVDNAVTATDKGLEGSEEISDSTRTFSKILDVIDDQEEAEATRQRGVDTSEKAIATEVSSKIHTDQVDNSKIKDSSVEEGTKPFATDKHDAVNINDSTVTEAVDVTNLNVKTLMEKMAKSFEARIEKLEQGEKAKQEQENKQKKLLGVEKEKLKASYEKLEQVIANAKKDRDKFKDVIKELRQERKNENKHFQENSEILMEELDKTKQERETFTIEIEEFKQGQEAIKNELKEVRQEQKNFREEIEKFREELKEAKKEKIQKRR